MAHCTLLADPLQLSLSRLYSERLSPPSRFIWNYIRLENEHLYNCGRFRATRDIHLNALSPHQERMLQSMMVEKADGGSGSEDNSYRHHLAKEYF